MRFNKLILVLLVALTVVSCRKDNVSEPNITIDPGPFEVVNTYTVDVEGFIKTPEGEAIPNATVIIDGYEVTSTENGLFSLQKIEAPNTGLYVKAQAEGFFVGGTTLYAYKNQVYTVHVTLIPYQNFETFDSSTGLEFVDEDGTEVKIPANGIVDDQGNAYNGSVDFYAFWIDPTDEDMPNLSPGNLVGVQENELVTLRSYGMIGVELVGAGGQELNLADGVNANLSFPIPTELQSSADSEIDLWHFNETTGIWDLEGTATLVDGAYQAEVSHFSWWNCDVPFNSTFFCFNVIDNLGEPVSNVTLTVYAAGFGYASANIGPSGTYCDLVPVGQTLDVTLSSFCGDEIVSASTQAVGDDEEFTINVPIGTGQVDLVEVSGTLECGSNGPVTNGYAVIEIGNETYFDYVDDNGEYSIFVLNCDGQEFDGELTGYNLDELTGGSEMVTVGPNGLDLDIDACEEDLTESFFTITSDGDSNTMYDCIAHISVAEITIIAKDLITNDGNAILGVLGFGEDTYGGNLISTYWSGGLGSETELNAITVEISNYTEVPGELIVGTFNYGTEVIGSFAATVQ